MFWQKVKSSSNNILELKAVFSSCIGQGLNSSMVKVSASIEDNLGDSFLQTVLGNHFAHFLCYFNCRTWSIVHLLWDVLLHCRNCCECVHLGIINHLDIEMFVRAEDTQSRPFWCPFNLKKSSQALPNDAMSALRTVELAFKVKGHSWRLGDRKVPGRAHNLTPCSTNQKGCCSQVANHEKTHL